MRGVYLGVSSQNQIGASSDYSGALFEGLSPGLALLGVLDVEGFGAVMGEVRDSNADLASSRMRSDLFSTTPKTRNGIAVAATRSLARRGIFASGSQRKS